MTPCQDKRAAVDRPPALPGRRPALSARALLLVTALEAAPAGVSRFARFGRKKSAYVASLVYEPGDSEFGACVETGAGVDAYRRCRAIRASQPPDTTGNEPGAPLPDAIPARDRVP